MLKKLLFVLLITVISGPSFSQSYEEELNFQYVKAKYLVDTERWEDAVNTLNDIIKQDIRHEDALLLRAQAKYMLAAYKGAKSDALSSIEYNGITKETASLYAKILYALNDYDSAMSTLDVAISSDPKNSRNYDLRADIFMLDDRVLSACADWEKAAQLGSSKSSYNLEKYCGKKVRKKPVVKKPTYERPTLEDEAVVVLDEKPNREEDVTGSDSDTTEDRNGGNEEDVDSSGFEYDASKVDDDMASDDDYFEEEDLDKENSIEIDEDLTLVIHGRGLGSRKVLDRPSILILSDEDGDVTVEVCVNERGKVVNAEFDPKKSSISKKSLVSLAIRKAKDFWFEKSRDKEQCGYIVFKIRAS